MRRLIPLSLALLVLLVVALLVGRGGIDSGSDVGAGHRNRLVVFGHSFTLRPRDHAWPTIVADRNGLDLVNVAANGGESSDVAVLVLDYQPEASDTVVIEPFLNDVRRFGTEPAGMRSYRQSLTLMLEHLASGIKPRVVVIVEDPPIRDWRSYPPYDHGSTVAESAYREVTERVAASYGVSVVNAGSRWDAASMIGSDGVHPTKVGANLIAATVTNRAAR